MLAHLAGNMRGHDVPVLELDPEHGIRERLGDRPFHFNMFFLSHKTTVPYHVKRGIIPENDSSERLTMAVRVL